MAILAAVPPSLSLVTGEQEFVPFLIVAHAPLLPLVALNPLVPPDQYVTADQITVPIKGHVELHAEPQPTHAAQTAQVKKSLAHGLSAPAPRAKSQEAPDAVHHSRQMPHGTLPTPVDGPVSKTPVTEKTPPSQPVSDAAPSLNLPEEDPATAVAGIAPHHIPKTPVAQDVFAPPGPAPTDKTPPPASAIPHLPVQEKLAPVGKEFVKVPPAHQNPPPVGMTQKPVLF